MKFKVRVRAVSEELYEVEAEDVDAAWALDPAEFTEDQLELNEGEDIRIIDVVEVP